MRDLAFSTESMNSIPQSFPNLQPHLRFSANLADTLGSGAGIYYYVRFIDKEGQGWATIDLNSAATALDRAPKTVVGQIYRAKQKGLFYRAYKQADGSFFVQYKSDVKLCKEYGIGFGAIASIPLAQLPNLRYLAADATLEAIQKSSIAKAQQLSKTNQDDRRVLDLDRLFADFPSSVKSRGTGILAIGRRCVYLSEQIVPVGGKQVTAATCLDRSRSTIQRRLNNTIRSNRNVPPIQKAQLAVRTKIIPKAIDSFKTIALETSDLDLFHESRRYFIQTVDGKNQVFYACTNVYNSDCIELSRQRNKRRRLKKAIEGSPGQSCSLICP